MLGFIVKIVFLTIVIMVGLNIFSPAQADKVLSIVSENVEIEKNTLKNNLDIATKFTQDTINEVTQTVQNSLSE